MIGWLVKRRSGAEVVWLSHVASETPSRATTLLWLTLYVYLMGGCLFDIPNYWVPPPGAGGCSLGSTCCSTQFQDWPGGGVLLNGPTSYLEVVVKGVEACLLKCICNWGVEPGPISLEAGHHVGNSTCYTVVEAPKGFELGFGENPALRTIQKNVLHNGLVEKTTGSGRGPLPGKDLDNTGPLLAGFLELTLEGGGVTISVVE